MIEVGSLRKVFGNKVAVDGVDFTVHPGQVTGFLGPNGAGKSTTMRLIIGLDHPTEGYAHVNGKQYSEHALPITEVGVLLDAKAIHPGRTARDHLRVLARTHRLGNKRVEQVIEMVGLGPVANKRAGSFSLGMGQRLGLATALLGDPSTLILDEPVNGLDPEGVAWVRVLVKSLAAQGRTIFLSSHLMSEMALTADHVIVIGRGRLLANASMKDLIEQASGMTTRVRSEQAEQIAHDLIAVGVPVTRSDDGALLIEGVPPVTIGELALQESWVLSELAPVERSLEDIYLELVEGSQEYSSSVLPIDPGSVDLGDDGDEMPVDDGHVIQFDDEAPSAAVAASDEVAHDVSVSRDAEADAVGVDQDQIDFEATDSGQTDETNQGEFLVYAAEEQPIVEDVAVEAEPAEVEPVDVLPVLDKPVVHAAPETPRFTPRDEYDIWAASLGLSPELAERMAARRRRQEGKEAK